MTKSLMIPAYTYLYEILECAMNGDKLPVDELIIFGGRKSGKSISVQILIYFLAKHVPNVGIYCIRSSVLDSAELYHDILETFDFIDGDYRGNMSSKRITVGDNKIRVLGLNSNQKGNKAKKAGLAKSGGSKYIIRYWEEAFEFKDSDKLAVKEATRSLSSENDVFILDIYVANPWAKSSTFVSYAERFQKWDINTLKETGSQFGIYTDTVGEGNEKRKRKIGVHYTNWRVAENYLPEDDIKNILNTWNLDRNRALTVDYGLPGFEEGAIYTHLLDKIGKSIWMEQEYLFGGGDYGWSQRAAGGKTAFYFCGFSYDNGLDIYGEYYHDNSKYVKNLNILAQEVVVFYIKMMSEYLNRIGKYVPPYLSVRVDNMADGIIQLLNNEAKLRQADGWLRFTSCAKHPIQDRIIFVLAALAQSSFRVSDNSQYPVKHLVGELEMARYEDIETQKRVKEADHCLNALEYALEKVQYKWLKKIGNWEMLRKGKRNKLWQE